MWRYNYSSELYHYGVKGMKWGVRKKYRNADGSLNDKGIKKYAKKAYSKEAFKSNKTVGGKIYDAYTGAHKISGQMKYDSSSKKQNKEAAEKYLNQKNSKNKTSKKVTRTVAKGTAKVGSIMATIGMAKLTDDIFYGGAGSRALKAVGRKSVEAIMKARGHTVVGWR